MTGPWDDRTPKAKYRMLWGGAWRPVLSMFDSSNTPTTSPGRAVKAVLFAWTSSGEGQMVVASCGPADIMTTPDHRTTEWEEVH